MKLKIIKNQFYLNIVNANDSDHIIYQTEIEHLGDRLSNHSDLINQLIGRLYFTNEMLYNIAAIIQTEYPDNSFDWKSQFFQVECSDYFDREFNLKYGDVSNKSGEVNFSLMSKRMLMQIDERTPEVDSKIKETVIQNLKKYNIL